MTGIRKGSGPPELDWADLHLFLAIAQTKSLTAAAKRLKTTQPTVSKRLDELERRLGAQLAVRSPTGVTLTESGIFVADHAASMERAAERITHEIGKQDSVPAGEVNLASPDGLGAYFLAPAIGDFAQSYPGIRLHIHTKERPSAPAPDLRIQFEETKSMEEVAVQLGWVHYVAFASENYLNLYGMPQALSDAFQHRHLRHLDYGAAQPETWNAEQKAIAELIEFAMQTDSSSLLLRAAAHSGGVCSLPTYAVRFEPELKMIEVGELVRVKFWLTFNHERAEISRVRETINWVKRVFDPRKNPWFKEEFIHPSEFEAV
jgi:DNA-binding transcriptional LysR family regulator